MFMDTPAILTFNYPLLPSSPQSDKVCNTTVSSAIWEAHFQYVFNDIPFVSNRIAAIAVSHIRRLELEEFLRRAT
ncbi:hypothetical protein PHYBLDRAFT_140776 [Phycomyces blakesleeanus NRRL 1555(-)]|uniref:Homeodomain-like DNA binding domain-containing transcription factor n=1 Tax=Phycomyces blakesleeanus (strain ATCC 8743b / DSM 1359 / FGSC 10004 / NBRC 33097 / NRRL 1555) TaxID=763407 RepID=A0A167PXK4_PHYB8|nr:hypothetical protein PHYBLDRAFT_140776 [Phycomyces blakesleeanus NRRL 1555(-)]OAD78719.1 hypothetical protein PHYBLDRAFT_140776 [Phycomyces blakesleeanus NRRL 1555(-)]|eukprot:XP_018296759.1 hypothetical protein PHYBLDRAFT_140776 [Phycomyces blakesleeanus NRRL 1555(-)]